MNWNHVSRKLGIVSLALGVTAGTLPGAASAAIPSQSEVTQNASSVQLGSKAYISPKLNTASSKEVRVIVQLSGQPAAVGKYAAKQGFSALAQEATAKAVQSQQTQVLNKAASAGLDLQVNYEFDTVFNGFEVTVPAKDIPKLAQLPGVQSIYENSTWYAIPDEVLEAPAVTPQNDNAPLEQIHADWAWAHGYTGKGLKIGVIDTGVDYTHPDIAPVYKGGYDSFYNDNDPYEEVPLKPDDDPFHVGYEGTSHGTHVAGTIIGQFKNTQGEIAQKGVAPGAELYAYKVLGRNLDDPTRSSGSSAQVIDGIERAVKDGMDVINLSLGADSEKDANSPDVIAINNAVLAGVTAVIANGNAGPGEYSLGSPATSQLAISVGAVNSPIGYTTGRFTPEFIGDSVTTATYSTYGEFHVMAWETDKEDFASILGTEPYEAVYVGLGDDKDYQGKDLNGKVAYISRGKLAFTDKIAKAKAHGAVAAVIFNGNASGSVPDLSVSIPGRDSFYGSVLGEDDSLIPTLDVRGIEGRALARAFVANPDTKVEFTFSSEYGTGKTAGDELASFTSWGPNADKDMSIKPDVTAPGVSVLSTYPAYGKDHPEISYATAYARLNGTSMATPHVAGASLLLKEARPGYTPFDIRAALANTADVVPAANGSYYVYANGAGRINIENAIKTPALVQSLEPVTILDKDYNTKTILNYNSSANFGMVSEGDSLSKALQLKNISSDNLEYTASIQWYDEHEGAEVTLDRNTVSVAAYSTQAFKLNLAVGKAVEGTIYQGQVTLTAPGQPELHIPFSAYAGSELWDTEFGVQEAKLTTQTLYPNRLVQNTADLSFTLTAKDANLYQAQIIGLDDILIGYTHSYYTGSPKKFWEPGAYTIKGIDGTYTPTDEEGHPKLGPDGKPVRERLKDGIYKVVAYAAQLDANGNVVRPDPDDEDVKLEYVSYTSIKVDNSAAPAPVPDTGTGPAPAPAPAPTAAPAAPAPAAAVVEQGFTQSAVTASAASSNGVTTVTVTDAALTAALANAAAAKTAVVITAPASADLSAKVSLTADQVKKLAGIQPQSTVVFSANGAAAALPVSLLADVPAGAALELAISKADNQAAALALAVTGSKVIGSPVSFTAHAVTSAGSVELAVPGDVFIKRSFTVPGSIEPNTAGVVFEENGRATPVASIFTKQADGTTVVTVNRPGFSTYAAVSRPVSFSDIASSPAASQITALANKLIINGTSEMKFSPKASLTRAEFTALLSRALGLRSDAAAAKSFTDVSSGAWYAADLAAASEAGLILGQGNGKFAPNASVSRQELAVILDRALKLTGIEVKVSNPSFTAYSDSAKIAPYAKESVQSLSAAGIITSSEGSSSFQPSAAANRETAAAALYQLLRQAGLIN